MIERTQTSGGTASRAAVAGVAVGCLALGFLFQAGGMSWAALPRAASTLAAFDHSNAATSYHAEFRIGRDHHRIRSLFVFVAKCRAQADAANVSISPDGAVSVESSFSLRKSGRSGTGTLSVIAQFLAPDLLSGTFRVTTPGCDTGPHPFSARPLDEHGAHEQPGLPPDIDGANATQRAESQQLLDLSKVTAARHFPTMSSAVTRGFQPHPRKEPLRPGHLFHLENCRNWVDTRVLDPTRPESLVYWNRPPGPPTLVAFMYRTPQIQPLPLFGGPIIRWHGHGDPETLMTHVWLTDDLRTAYTGFDAPPMDDLRRLFPALPGSVDHSSVRVAGAGSTTRQASASRRRVRLEYKVGRCYPVPPPRNPKKVKIKKHRFSAKSISIPRHASVRWVWTGRGRHRIRGVGNPSVSSSAKRAGSYLYTFWWTGRVRIVCTIHPEMAMTVTIR